MSMRAHHHSLLVIAFSIPGVRSLRPSSLPPVVSGGRERATTTTTAIPPPPRSSPMPLPPPGRRPPRRCHRRADDRRSFLRRTIAGAAAAAAVAAVAAPIPASASTAADGDGGGGNGGVAAPPPSSFHSAAYGIEEYTNSIVASRDTNVSPREVYDTIASGYLADAAAAAKAASEEEGGGGRPRRRRRRPPRALDVGAGAGVSTEVLWRMGYRRIDAVDWSPSAWKRYVVDDPGGRCPPGVRFMAVDDERYLDAWRGARNNLRTAVGNDIDNDGDGDDGDGGLFDAVVFNFAVNESKARQFATELLDKEHGRLLAPINSSDDYWMKQTYTVMDGRGKVLWSAGDVGAWSVQFQPDVTQDTVSERGGERKARISSFSSRRRRRYGSGENF
jgi:hypothetical protein